MDKKVSLPGNMTVEKLEALSSKDRFQIRENVRHSGLFNAEDKLSYLEVIDASGPCLDTTGITNNDPFSIAMEDIINSDAGKTACFAATEAGLPALAGVEPLIVVQLGRYYQERYMATVQAGYQVGTLMLSSGYKKSRQLPTPSGSIAKTGAYWKRNK